MTRLYFKHFACWLDMEFSDSKLYHMQYFNKLQFLMEVRCTKFKDEFKCTCTLANICNLQPQCNLILASQLFEIRFLKLLIKELLCCLR